MFIVIQKKFILNDHVNHINLFFYFIIIIIIIIIIIL